MKTYTATNVVALSGEKQIAIECFTGNELVKVILEKQAILDLIDHAIDWPGIGLDARKIVAKANAR